jgi:hypothetical protein
MKSKQKALGGERGKAQTGAYQGSRFGGTMSPQKPCEHPSEETGFDKSISSYILWFKNNVNTPYSGVLFFTLCSFRLRFMNKYAFLTEPARRVTELLEGSEGARNGFSLIIRTDDGSTMLKADVDYMHQAFQGLIDWSIEEVPRDACAVITGPNGFYADHRIKASQDFSWIEN